LGVGVTLVTPPGKPSAPSLNVALVSCRDLKLTSRRRSLLAETRARGPDGSRMRSPQLARCSRDQLRRRMGQHGAALARGLGGGCEVFRAPPSLGRQLEARQRAGRRATSESTVVDALLPTGPCLADPATPTGCGCVTSRPPGSRLRPPFYGDVISFLLHGHRAASPGAASLGAATRGAAMRGAATLRLACAAPPAPRRLRRAAFAATPAPRRLRRDA
jgi:hypothetical protein